MAQIITCIKGCLRNVLILVNVHLKLWVVLFLCPLFILNVPFFLSFAALSLYSNQHGFPLHEVHQIGFGLVWFDCDL